MTSKQTPAQAHCQRGIRAYVHWRADTLDSLDAAIDADENYALPRLVKAWILHGVRDNTMNNTIAQLISDAQKSIDPANDREMDYLAALRHARDGQGVTAATVLEGVLDRHPTDLLAHRLIQFELFWLGRPAWMCDITERAAPHWHSESEHYGPFLSMRAFANEEAGQYAQAERCGRMAIDIDPSDVWGAHAVAHVLVMKGQMDEGVDWLENLSSHWGHANQMRHHLWWHMCLFLLERGEHERILTLLSSEIRNPDSALIQAAPAATIDIQNYASLLMRLELREVDVGENWHELAAICANRVNNHANAFTNAHDMMVLAATGQFDKAGELLLSMNTFASGRQSSLATAYQSAGIAVCEAILAHRKKDYKAVINKLGAVRHDLALLGASHTQRDVFYQLLMDAACRQGSTGLRDILLRDIERIGFSHVEQRSAYKYRELNA